MAMVGEGKGFKTLVSMVAGVVLLTLPVFFLELHSPGLTLQQSADGGVAPVQIILDQRTRKVRLSTKLSAQIPENYPLGAHLRITSERGTTLVDWLDREVTVNRKRPEVIHVHGETASPATSWKTATVELKLYRAKTKILVVEGNLVTGSSKLRDVRQHKPGVDDES